MANAPWRKPRMTPPKEVQITNGRKTSIFSFFKLYFNQLQCILLQWSTVICKSFSCKKHLQTALVNNLETTSVTAWVRCKIGCFFSIIAMWGRNYSNRTHNNINRAYRPFTRGFVEAGPRPSLESQSPPPCHRRNLIFSQIFLREFWIKIKYIYLIYICRNEKY